MMLLSDLTSLKPNCVNFYLNNYQAAAMAYKFFIHKFAQIVKVIILLVNNISEFVTNADLNIILTVKDFNSVVSF